jgi:hypothetical protein
MTENRIKNLEPTVQAALDAYDDGHRLIADWFNGAFKKLELELQIDAGAPAKDLTLDDCRLQLANALQGIRPFSVDLPRDEQLNPWIVGYLCGQENEKGDQLAGVPLIEPNFPSPWGNEEAILNIVSVKYAYGWVTVDQWRRFVVEPMEQQANEWREWLGQFAVAPNLRLRFTYATNHPDADCKDLASQINNALRDPNDKRSQNDIAKDFFSNQQSSNALKVLNRLRKYESDQLNKINNT